MRRQLFNAENERWVELNLLEGARRAALKS